MLIKVLRIIVSLEWVFFIISVIALTILLYLVKNSKVGKVIWIFSFGQQKRSITEIKERLLKVTERLKIVKAEIFISSTILIISLLGIWYLIKVGYVDVTLSSEFFLISFLGVIPIPFAILLFEFYIRKIFEKIEELADMWGIKS